MITVLMIFAVLASARPPRSKPDGVLSLFASASAGWTRRLRQARESSVNRIANSVEADVQFPVVRLCWRSWRQPYAPEMASLVGLSTPRGWRISVLLLSLSSLLNPVLASPRGIWHTGQSRFDLRECPPERSWPEELGPEHRLVPRSVCYVTDNDAVKLSHIDEHCAYITRTKGCENCREAEILASSIAHRRRFAVVIRIVFLYERIVSLAYNLPRLVRMMTPPIGQPPSS